MFTGLPAIVDAPQQGDTWPCLYCQAPTTHHPFSPHMPQGFDPVTVEAWDGCGCDGFLKSNRAPSELAAERTDAQRKARLKAAGIPARFIDADAEVLAELEAVGRSQNVVIKGCTRSGKTTRAAAIAQAMIELGTPARFRSWPRFTDELHSSFDVRGRTDALVGELSTCGLLILDDLDLGNPRSWAVSRLFAIVNARYENELPTVATCRVNRDELVRCLISNGGDRTEADGIVDRLLRDCMPVLLPMPKNERN